MSYILFVLGFILLIKGADILVDGASSIARYFNISDLVIGLTVVSFGTSSPELFVNLIASAKGNTGIAIGNIVGSCIVNTLLILGIASVIYPLTVTKGTVWKEIPFGALAALILGILSNDRLIDHCDVSALTRSDGLVFLSFFVIFMYYSIGIAKGINGMDSVVPSQRHGILKASLLVIAGLAMLGLGGKWIVDGATHIALKLGMSESLVGLTIVAVGTSLPELATSAVAAYKKNVEIAVGNIVGSNIFNIFFILGISALLNPLPFEPRNNIDIGMTIFANLLLFFSMFTGGKRMVDRWEGIFFIFLYIGYIIFVITGI